MKRNFVVVLLILITSIAKAQYAQTAANSNGTGWRKVAYIDSNKKRGFGKITIYTPGGDFMPTYSDIYWYSNWDSLYTLKTEDLAGGDIYWQGIRITEDESRAYIEIDFKQHVTSLNILSDNYGYCVAKPYSGNLPSGSGTVRHKIRNARFNIANHLLVNEIGNVGIGTTSLLTARLAVNGLVRAKEIKVETAGWPDYVFREDYALPSLDSVAHYIRDRGHLPEIPKASEVEQDGVALGEMNRLLLKKIEELTLYLIENKDKVRELEARLMAIEGAEK